MDIAAVGGTTRAGAPPERTGLIRGATVAHEAVTVVGDERFHAAMAANPALAGRLLVCFLVEEAVREPLPVAGGEVLVAADALPLIAAWRRPDFPGAGRVVVVERADERGDPLGSPLSATQRALKRAFDIVVAGTALLLVLPVLLALILGARLTLREPGIFVQDRVGVDGRTFRLRKIRSMVTADDSRHRAYTSALIRGQAEQHGGMYKLVGDARVKRFGRVIRRLSLDELPQLWNVVRGDMSLVGPRPALPGEVDQYDCYAWQRLRVKPGITGAWQVSGRCTLSFAEMVALDVDYWRGWSIWRDVAITLRTPVVMLGGRGAA